MKINFILTGSAHRPIGGFKVVYEYANRFIRDGHQVVLIHPQMVFPPKLKIIDFLRWCLYWKRKITRGYKADSWFFLDPKIDFLWVQYLKSEIIPDADVTIATGWNTAQFVADLPARVGRKYYFIQHLETWALGGENAALETWKLPLNKIVIAQWLKEYASSIGEKACYVPNGLDFNAFGIDVPRETRAPASVTLLNHWRPYKGTKDALLALYKVKEVYPDLTVTLFGIAKPIVKLPDWVTFYQNPTQAQLRALYNQSSVFVAPSHTEGWGLTACEAMMCGCAVVATDVGGHREFAINNETALIVPPNDVNALADSIQLAISDKELRDRLSNAAIVNLKKFKWETSYASFFQALIDFASCQ